jgi:hypothetical protein
VIQSTAIGATSREDHARKTARRPTGMAGRRAPEKGLRDLGQMNEFARSTFNVSTKYAI